MVERADTLEADLSGQNLLRHVHPRKRRRVDGASPASTTTASEFPQQSKRHASENATQDIDFETTETKNGESIAALRKMVLGKEVHKGSQTAPGKYLALDCEMVGVGIEGSESSLARVSIVNYMGAVILDVFVRQRERVIDYRTQWSGVRSTDLAGSAKPFKEVQQAVADLIKDRILIGHAIYNDLKALLLSHPSPQVRDTQALAYKHHVVKSRRPALRVLVKQELGIVIQGGEHNSVTDARATMALFRLYRKQWEGGFRPFRKMAQSSSRNKTSKGPVNDASEVVRPSQVWTSSPTWRRKRTHSDTTEEDKDGVDGVVEPLSRQIGRHEPLPSSSASRTRSAPSRHRNERSELQSCAVQRKGAMSTIPIRARGTRQIRRKGTRVDDEGPTVGNGAEIRKGSRKVEEKWWQNLGGFKKGSIQL